MISRQLCWASLLLFAATINAANSYKILGVLPTAARSHFFVGDSLMKNLAKQGHDVTVISPFPPTEPIKNYRNIYTPAIKTRMKAFSDTLISLHESTVFANFFRMYRMGLMITNSTLSEPTVQKLMASNESFDVVVCEVFITEALFGLAEHFNATLIGLTTFGATQWNTDLVGSPSPTSYVPNPFLSFTHKMTLAQRVINQAVATFEYIFFNNYYMPKQNALFQKYFPKSRLGLDKIRRNTALVLLNSYVSLGFPRPYMPNMIEVGGMHINRQRKPLPADMLKFIDEARDGVIYFSMGSYLKGKILPLDKRTTILDTFKFLKQRVLWKFEDTNLPNKSDNIYISDWFPQDDILAHPNVKLFITHGGLLSTTESIYHHKPFIGIPMFGDQFLNLARAEAGGYGIMVDYKLLNRETFSAAINKMLKDPTYTMNVKEISKRYRDQPQEPLNLATYWVEYVARHKGAPHLHSAGQDLNFIQYHNLDAMLILYGTLLSLLALVLFVLFKLVLRFLGLPKKTQMKVKKN